MKAAFLLAAAALLTCASGAARADVARLRGGEDREAPAGGRGRGDQGPVS